MDSCLRFLPNSVQYKPMSTQNTTLQPRRYIAAGFLRRLFAAMLDFILLLPLWALFFIVLTKAFEQPLPNWREWAPDLFLGRLVQKEAVISRAFFFSCGISLFLYDFLFHALWGRTPGEQILHILVIDEYGQPPTLVRALVRALAAMVSLVVFCIGFLWIGFDKHRRGLHDLIARTYVVRFPRV